MELTRRRMLEMCSLTALSIPGSIHRLGSFDNKNPGSDLVTEDQKGDPADVDEFVTFSSSAIRNMSTRGGKASFEPWRDGLHKSIIATARQFIGVNRKTNPEAVTQFLDLFSLPFRTDTGFVAFCAAGISYCALSTYCEDLRWQVNDTNRLDRYRQLMPDLEFYYFYPTVSCVDMYHIAAGKRRWVDHRTKPKIIPSPGWIVLYDWKGKGVPDHCGLVQQASQKEMLTLEFNTSPGDGSQTNGGAVAERRRSYTQVYGFVITDEKPKKG